jgi:ribonuclease E
MRLWENVRDMTLGSTAPALVYEEGSLIKRAIRDLYTKDVEEVQVEGEDAYHEAKDFMKMLMPSHARNVKLYKDTRPLFSRFQVETQLDSLFSQTVTLQSGGYMVINQTEALVSIDINSGKATREHNIEDTALKTNLEASDEVARQLRLRDLAGLVVIDFIDMEEKRNNRSVERRLKDALKHDRARIQVGRISHFGLLEMSRQRLRPSLLEGSTRMCPNCEGRGIVRSVSSCALSVLRAIEEQLISRKPENLTVKCAREVASYILNEKRDHLLSIEGDYQISIFLVPSDEVQGSQAVIERGGERAVSIRKPHVAAVKVDSVFEEPEAVAEQEPVEASEPAPREERPSTPSESSSGSDPNRRKRRRGRRGGRRSDRDTTAVQRSSETVPGLGDQPAIADTSGEPPEEAVAQPASHEDERQAEPQATVDKHDRNKRDRPDRGKSRHRPERSERPPREESKGNGLGSRHPAPPIVPAITASEASPRPAEKRPEPAPAPEPRKWQPPAPTLAERPPQPKAGWWSKR